VPERAWTVIGVLVGLVVLVVAYRWVHHEQANLGVDLNGPLDGARSFARGTGSIYSRRANTYLPSSAVIFRPVARTGVSFLHVMAYVDVAAMLVMAYGACWALIRRSWWLLAAGVLALVVFKSDVAIASGSYLNLNMDLCVAALFAMVLMRDEQWASGTGVVAASILVKPILAPLLVVPLFYLRWRPVVVAVVVVGCLEAISASVTPGGWRLSELHHNLSYWPSYLGTIDDNFTLKWLAHSHGIPGAISGLVRLAIGLGVLLAGARARRGTDPLILGYAIFLASMVVGSYFEASYCFLLIPLPVIAWQLRRQALAAGALLIGSLAFFAPWQTLGGHFPVAALSGAATLALLGLLGGSLQTGTATTVPAAMRGRLSRQRAGEPAAPRSSA
jgi:hypothetical protein